MATANLEEKRKFRGKFLGKIDISNIDEFIKSHGIADGTFDDLCVGDYFISEITTDRERVVVFRIADFDIYAGTESSVADRHHICVVPDDIITMSRMYDYHSDWYSSGYATSELNQVYIKKLDYALQTALFGDHLLKYTELLSVWPYYRDIESTVIETKPVEVQCMCMNTIELQGEREEYALDESENYITKQLALFEQHIDFKYTTCYYWLRDIDSYIVDEYFVYVVDKMFEKKLAPTTTGISRLGIRPRFLLG